MVVKSISMLVEMNFFHGGKKSISTAVKKINFHGSKNQYPRRYKTNSTVVKINIFPCDTRKLLRWLRVHR